MRWSLGPCFLLFAACGQTVTSQVPQGTDESSSSRGHGGETRGDDSTTSESGDEARPSSEQSSGTESDAAPTGTETAAETSAGVESGAASESTGGPSVTGDSATDGSDEGSETGSPQIVSELPVAEVWSGHPVAFALVTAQEMQFVAYYDPQRRMTVASRALGSEAWSYTVLPSTVGWDSHNSIAMAVDADGYVHVSGNMHVVPLVYFRTADPLDIATFVSHGSMVGTHEGSCTYPEFFHGPSGELVFAYRDGGSGNGNHIFNAYTLATQTWRRLLDTPLTDGQGSRNAYPVGPIQGPGGVWHLVWVWRDTPDASTNHDLSYARTTNLIDWQSAAGAALQLPVTLGGSDIVDPVPAGGGMINNNTKVGFDAQDRPVVVFHKFDAAGNTQLYNARFEDGAWVVHQTSDWDYRWEFGGGGTLQFEIEVEGVRLQPDGRLTQTYYHAQYGGWGAFVLDPDTLEALETIDPPLPYPRELDEPRSGTEGMVVRWQSDATVTTDASAPRAMLRWETLPSNRDMPREPIPPPTPLVLYTFTR